MESQGTRVRFNPQMWDGDNAIPVDIDGREDEWDVGEIDPAIQSHTYESDDLRYHPNAPDWVRDWSGPFEIDILDASGEPIARR